MIIINSITGCSFKQSDQTPALLNITAGNQQVGYTAVKKEWDGSVYDVKNPFVSIFKQTSQQIEFKHIEFGEKAILVFDGKLPDSITVKDDILKNNGEYKYTDKETVEVPVTAESDNKFTFIIEKNLASALSSLRVVNGTDIRGYRITASWGDNECVYAFMIKTSFL